MFSHGLGELGPLLGRAVWFLLATWVSLVAAARPVHLRHRRPNWKRLRLK